MEDEVHLEDRVEYFLGMIQKEEREIKENEEDKRNEALKRQLDLCRVQPSSNGGAHLKANDDEHRARGVLEDTGHRDDGAEIVDANVEEHPG